jgi:hypothetical protein
MVKKLAGFILLLAMSAGACSSVQGEQPAVPDITIDTQATIDAIVQESLQQTAAARPSPTPVPPTSTAPSASAASPIPATLTASSTPLPSPTPLPNLTTTPVTATSAPTETVTPAPPSNPTSTRTPGALLYGTLPPAVPSASILIINKSKAQVYISLQNYPPDKAAAFLEYPVRNQVRVDAPLGYYLYVVWVGGRQITGSFRLHKGDSLTIIIFKDRVIIKP